MMATMTVMVMVMVTVTVTAVVDLRGGEGNECIVALCSHVQYCQNTNHITLLTLTYPRTLTNS
jgi:hypothetical protein